jgi:hypothetical protein
MKKLRMPLISIQLADIACRALPLLGLKKYLKKKYLNNFFI